MNILNVKILTPNIVKYALYYSKLREFVKHIFPEKRKNLGTAGWPSPKGSALAFPHEAEEVEEEVDEVQIELEGGEDGGLLRHLGVVPAGKVVVPDALGVISGEAQEDGDADEAVKPL